MVHEKGSLLNKMPGDRWQQFANLRLLMAYMYTLPGYKLLFMGAEFAQSGEWSHDGSLEWDLLADRQHGGMQLLVNDLGHRYSTIPALQTADAAGFQWVVGDDRANSVFAFLRGVADQRPVLIVLNATPVSRDAYRVGVPLAGHWEELLNSDAEVYGGSGVGNQGGRWTEVVGAHGFAQSLVLTLPPLGAIALVPTESDR